MDGGCRVPPPLWFVWPSHVHLSSHFAASCHAAKRRWRGKLWKQSMATRYIHTCSFPLLSCTYPFLREDVDLDPPTHHPVHYLTDVSNISLKSKRRRFLFLFLFVFLSCYNQSSRSAIGGFFFLVRFAARFVFFYRYNLAPQPGHSVSLLALLVRLLDLL